VTANPRLRPFGLVEVMTVSQDCPGREPVGIERLFGVDGREEKTIRSLGGRLADPREVQAATRAPAACARAGLPEALTVGYRMLGEAAAP